MSRPERPEERGIFGRIAAEASDRVLDIVDPNLLLDNVDVNTLLDKVDVDELLDRVDVNRLLERVDMEALMARVDIDQIMERVDIKAIVERAGIPEIVAESTSHLTGSALDLARRPLVGLDEIAFRSLNRVVGRNPDEMPQGPSDLVEWVDDKFDEDAGNVKTGRYAGPVTRLLAVIVDFFIVTVGFTIIAAGTTFLIQLFASDYQPPEQTGWFSAIALAVWAFAYLWFSWGIFGKTIGMTLLGIRVVASDGSVRLNRGKALIRTLTYPLSFVFLGLGLLGVVWGRERRAWHDHFAGTSVVYDWGSRTASLPTPLAKYLESKQVDA